MWGQELDQVDWLRPDGLGLFLAESIARFGRLFDRALPAHEQETGSYWSERQRSLPECRDPLLRDFRRRHGVAQTRRHAVRAGFLSIVGKYLVPGNAGFRVGLQFNQQPAFKLVPQPCFGPARFQPLRGEANHCRRLPHHPVPVLGRLRTLLALIAGNPGQQIR